MTVRQILFCIWVRLSAVKPNYAYSGSVQLSPVQELNRSDGSGPELGAVEEVMMCPSKVNTFIEWKLFGHFSKILHRCRTT